MPTQTQGPVNGKDNEESSAYPHPDLGPGHNSASGNPNDPRGHNIPAGNSSDPRGEGPDSIPTPRELEDAENAGLYNAAGDSVTGGSKATGDTAGGGEESGVDNLIGGGYSQKGKTKSKGRSRFRVTRGRAALGGIGSIALITGLFGFLSIGSGPFEFIHVAELLIHGNLSNQQDASNQEFGKEVRYLRSGGDYGETRLGYLGSKMKTTMLEQLSDVGMKPIYDNNAIFQGIAVDPDEENSIFHGMNNDDQIASTLEENGVSKDSFSVSPLTNEDGSVDSFIITPNKGLASGYFNKKGLTKFLVGQMEESNIPDALRARELNKYGFITWHPFVQEAENDLNQKANDEAAALWQKALEKFQSTGQASGELGTAGAESTSPGANGTTETEPVAGAGSEDGSLSFAKTSKILSSFKDSKGVKVTGGIAAAVGLLCTVNTINSHIGEIRYAQDVLPLTRMGTTAITEGQQVMSNDDDSLDELNLESKHFTDSSGKSWSDSQTFESDSGEALTGEDMRPDVKGALNESSPAWLSWISSVPGIGGLCSGIGAVATGIVSVAVGIFSAEIASTAISTAVGAIAVPGVISNISHLVAGDAVNVAKDAGPDWGNDVNYGAKLFGNASAAQDGGTILSAAQLAVLNGQQQAAEKAQFDSQSLAYRLFNPYDDQSLVSKLIDSQSPNVGQNLQNMATDFLGWGHSLITLPSDIFSSVANADSTTPSSYQYPFPTYGFSQADLDNPLVQDPYANANYVAKLLDNNGQNGEPDYISMVAKCFNDTIEKDSQGLWDVVPGASSDPSALNIYDPTTYSSSQCLDSGNNDWLRVRFFVFDTAVMEGYACEHGDAQSCQNDGYSDSSTPSTSPTTTASKGYFTVTGSKIYYQNGSEFIPYGISVIDDLDQPDWQNKTYQAVADAQIQAAATYWHINTIRIQVSEVNFMEDPSSGVGYNIPAMQRLEKEINEIEGLGKIPILSNNLKQTDNGEVAPTSRTVAFWKAVTGYLSTNGASSEYDNIIFDIFNEPRGGITWNQWQKGDIPDGYVGMQDVVNAIRNSSNSLSNNLIMAEGPNNATTLSQLDQYPLTGANIAYAYHHVDFTQPSSTWENDIGLNLKTPVPIIDGEWAQYENSTNECYPQAPQYLSSYLSVLQSNNIGLIFWSLEGGVGTQTNNLQPGISQITGAFPTTASAYSQPNSFGSNYTCSVGPNGDLLGQGAGSEIMSYFEKYSQQPSATSTGE